MTGGSGYQGRYGSTNVPGISGPDPLNMNRWFAYGQKFWNFANVNNAGAYGSPPDPFGVGVVGLDMAGWPLYEGMQRSSTLTYWGYGSATADNPYEMNLASNVSHGLSSGMPNSPPNNPFSVAELEQVLRPYDADAPRLPNRITTLAPSLSPSNNPGARLAVTTESWDIRARGWRCRSISWPRPKPI